jgi:hypothetical protein
MPKRARDLVQLTVTDSAELISVDRTLLVESKCRLGLAIVHDETTDSGMSKAMLLSFMRSLLHGQLSLGKGVSYMEAMSTFEYEGVSFHGFNGLGGGNVPTLCAGGSTAHHAAAMADELSTLCEQLATHLTRWPRLCKTCRTSIFGKTGVTATPTRVWVRLLTRPNFRIRGDGGHLSSLISKWPSWMVESLCFVGCIYDRLVCDGQIEANSCCDHTMRLMMDQQDDYLGFSVHDGALTTVQVKRNRTRLDHFVRDVRAVLLEPDAYPPKALDFAKACLQMSLEELDGTPSLGHVFAALGDKGAERSLLGKALKARGVTLVKWADAEEEARITPLAFPPMWASAHETGPCLLLDVS